MPACRTLRCGQCVGGSHALQSVELWADANRLRIERRVRRSLSSMHTSIGQWAWTGSHGHMVSDEPDRVITIAGASLIRSAVSLPPGCQLIHSTDVKFRVALQSGTASHSAKDRCCTRCRSECEQPTKSAAFAQMRMHASEACDRVIASCASAPGCRRLPQPGSMVAQNSTRC